MKQVSDRPGSPPDAEGVSTRNARHRKRPLIVVMGVSGSGKSTIGRLIAESLGLTFVDADSLHSDENVAKMRNGHPLTDDDRGPWLEAILTVANNYRTTGLVLACSALKREYRNKIFPNSRDVVYVHLDGNREVLATRLRDRAPHFMSSDLLDSQLATLEPLGRHEPGVVVDIDTPVEKTLADALSGIWRLTTS